MLEFLYTIIIYPLVQIIEFSFMLFYSVFKNVGISVIGVSLAVSLLCLPLYIVAESWQQVQRDTEKRLDGGIRRIKSVFKGDEQYMILSTYYRQNHYHPLMALRSSFGLLIQIPFFIAAYGFLSQLPILKGQGFLFIKDMGVQDAYFHIGSFPINVLPIAMTLINIIAGAIYTKGFKFKDKATIYGMALVFLAILYTSPAGLVLYWTMNNVFSLVKNVFYKLKHPVWVLYAMVVASVLAVDYYVLFIHDGFLHKRMIMAFVVSILLLSPLFVKGINWLLDNWFKPLTQNAKLRFTIYIVSALSICLLAGFLIPSMVIKSSVIEFSNIDGISSPLYFLYNSTCQAFGLVVFWTLCIYFLFKERIQTIIALFLTFILFGGLVNSFVFSGDYGNLSRVITFSESITSITKLKQALNFALLLLTIVLPLLLLKFKQEKLLSAMVSIILMAEISLSVYNCFTIASEYNSSKQTIVDVENSISPYYHLAPESSGKKNVMVIMLDRAESAFLELIFNDDKENGLGTLSKTFQGFTLYRNTVSYNQGTLLGAPALFGGYEYSPYEMNKRKDMSLESKHNEALMVMPTIFAKNGFEATVADLSWSNYSWIPDMTFIENQVSGQKDKNGNQIKVNHKNIERRYTSLWISDPKNAGAVQENITSNCIKRNFGWFSLFKMVPPILRDSVYDDGAWWSSDNQTTDIMEFIDYYSGLDYLPELTAFDSENDNFIMFVNDTTHSGQQLEYYPVVKETDSEGNVISIKDHDFRPAIKVSNLGNPGIGGIKNISAQYATYLRLAEWLNKLKENHCYDNTRIIFVADHGIGTDYGRDIAFEKNWPFKYNPDKNNPLLLVKDFNATGDIIVNYDFMVNADVPSLATNKIISDSDRVNPYTGKPIQTIDPATKKAVGVVITHNWRPGGNSVNTFKVPESDWYTISKNIFEAKNWVQGIKE